MLKSLVLLGQVEELAENWVGKCSKPGNLLERLFIDYGKGQGILEISQP